MSYKIIEVSISSDPCRIKIPTSKIHKPKSKTELIQIIKNTREYHQENDLDYICNEIDLSDFVPDLASAPKISLYKARNIQITGVVSYPVTFEYCNHIIVSGLTSKVDILEDNTNHMHESVTSAISVRHCIDVTLKHLVIQGDKFSISDIEKIHEGLDYSVADCDLIKRQSAVSAKDCYDLSIQSCYVKNVYNAFILVDIEKLECKRNIAHYVICDVFKCQGIKHAVIRNNYRGRVLAYQVKRFNCDKKKVHSDFIQIMCPEQQSDPKPSSNVTIQHNQDLATLCSKNNDITGSLLALINTICSDTLPIVSSNYPRSHAVGVQGIFIRSEKFDANNTHLEYRHKNISVIGNTILNTQYSILNTQYSV